MKTHEEDKNVIQEINQHISDALEHWAKILVSADADEWAYFLNYSDKDVLHAIWIANCVLQNVAIKSNYINESNATEKGKLFKQAIKDYCNIDTIELVDKVYPITNNTNETKAS